MKSIFWNWAQGGNLSTLSLDDEAIKQIEIIDYSTIAYSVSDDGIIFDEDDDDLNLGENETIGALGKITRKIEPVNYLKDILIYLENHLLLNKKKEEFQHIIIEQPLRSKILKELHLSLNHAELPFLIVVWNRKMGIFQGDVHIARRVNFASMEDLIPDDDDFGWSLLRMVLSKDGRLKKQVCIKRL